MANQDQVLAAKRRKYGVTSPNNAVGRGIPPDGMYTLRLERIIDLDYSKGFQGEEPKLQYTLEFSIQDYDDPDTGQPMLIQGWATPKLHAIKGYNQPKLYKWVTAMNGGVPIELPTDDDGNVLEYNHWDILEQDFIGKEFRDVLTLNDRGWARISGEKPLPVRAARPPQAPVRSKPKPKPVEVDEETGEIVDDLDDNF